MNAAFEIINNTRGIRVVSIKFVLAIKFIAGVPSNDVYDDLPASHRSDFSADHP